MRSRTVKLAVVFFTALSLSIMLAARSASAQGSSFSPQVSAHLGSPSTGPDPETFVQFSRYPTEVLNFIQMTGTPPTAYYRDEFVGGETFTTGANDQDAIYAQLFNSSGTLLSTWSSFVFYANYVVGTQTLQNCWVTFGIQPLCGSNSIDVLWYYQSQCGDGNFSMQFYLNNVPIAATPFPFTVLPQIEESRVPNYSQVRTTAGTYEQNDPAYAYDFECRYVDVNGNVINNSEKHTCHSPALLGNEIPYYIRAKGCYLSDAANLLTYQGTSVDPPTLNTALDDLNLNTGGTTPPPPPGYVNYGVNPAGLHRYSGGQMSFVDRSTANLNSNVCHYGPQIMGVKCVTNPNTGQVNATHWVTVFGKNSDKSSWLIHDPGSSQAGTGPNGGVGGASGTLQSLYGGQFCEARSFSGPAFSFVTETGLTIQFHSPVELLMTNPSGLRLGGDPVLHAYYEEIPNSYYESAGLVDDETGIYESDPPKTMYIPGAATGQYTLTVTGTDTSAYSADFLAQDANGTPSVMSMSNVPIGLGEVQTFTLNYSSTAGSTLQVTGGFNGGGQNPNSVNLFLSYAKPGDSHVTLATGTTSYTVVIFYATDVIASTFSATIGGIDITSLFHPQPGTSEAVSIPLQAGRNLLNLQIQGNVGSRVATDTDRLVFTVQ